MENNWRAKFKFGELPLCAKYNASASPYQKPRSSGSMHVGSRRDTVCVMRWQSRGALAVRQRSMSLINASSRRNEVGNQLVAAKSVFVDVNEDIA